MGILISRFRANPSTRELLEELEKEIETLEEYKRSTELQQKAVVRSLVFYSMILYVLVAGVFLFYSFPVETKDRIIYCIPLLIFPILLFILKKFLHWYFLQKIRSNDECLIDLKRKKKSLLDFAMETETYKNVKELLERFDPEYHKKIFEPRPAIEAPPTPPIKGTFSDMELRRRNLPSKASPPIALGPSGTTISPGQTLSINTSAVRPPVQPMPRPVLPRERTLVDRFVDYLVGDGPSNRYALICRQCQSHNGMALKEEFEFIAFRCCYCFTWNPPRNQQPPPPRLTLPAPPGNTPAITDSPASDVSSSSGLDEDGTETKESINEADADLKSELDVRDD